MIVYTKQPLSLLELALSQDNTVNALEDTNGNGNGNTLSTDTNSLDTGLGNMLSQD